MSEYCGTVLDRNACRHCRRPVTLLREIGWIHAELPAYAHEEPTCGRAEPVDPRCPHCDALVPGLSVLSGVRVAQHTAPGYPGPCPGSGAIVPP